MRSLGLVIACFRFGAGMVFFFVTDPDGCQDDGIPVTIKFFVKNFGLLKEKAEQHERFVAMIKEIETLRSKVELQMNELLNGPALSRVLQPHYMDRFESAGRVAQEDLLLSVYMGGLDPHDCLSDMDTDVHDHVYDHDSDPCVKKLGEFIQRVIG